MGRLIFDTEGDGLLFHIKNVWCIVTQDADTGEVNRYRPASILKAIDALQYADCVIGHNVIGYDLPALWKLYGEWDAYPLVVDTLLTSRFFFPERYGGHGLAAWGERLGDPKIEFDDYSQYSEEMLTYCTQDVSLNAKVLLELEKEAGEKLTGFKVYT